MLSVIFCFLSVFVVAPPAIEDPKEINPVQLPAEGNNDQTQGVVAIQGPPAAKCSAVGLNRQDCGFPGITADQCAIKGCCFDAQSLGPYCFYADEAAFTSVNAINPVKDACCTYADVFRVSCGDGLTQLECTNKGCCFSDVSEIKCAFGFIPISNAAIVAPQVVNNQIQQGIVIGQGDVQIQGNQGGECTAIAADARKDCGFYGITKEECTQKNCCWGILPVGQEGPVCYQNNASPKAVGYKNAD